MTNAEARFNHSLRPRKPEGSLGRTAQDVHLDSHTAPELYVSTNRAGTDFLYRTARNRPVAGRQRPTGEKRWGNSGPLTRASLHSSPATLIMYIYHALINALSAHMIHINLNMIFCTHVEHSPTKTIYIKYYKKTHYTHTHTHTHTLTVAETGY